jgi:integrase
MGTVRIRQRGKTFSYSFDIGKTNGKRKMIEKGGFANRDEAYEAGTAAYTDWKHGNIGITSEKITIRDFLNRWMENVVSKSVKPSSFSSYEYRKKAILSYIGDKILQEIKPRDIDAIMLRMADKGLSYNTIQKTKTYIHEAFSYAVYPAELIQSNPADSIKIPKSSPKEVRKRIVLSKEKWQEVLDAFPFGHKHHIPIMLAYHTGMRFGEIMGLTWDNVDLKKNTIHVVQQYRYIHQLGNYLSTPKTPSSVRSFMIDDILSSELRRWHALQAANEVKLGERYIYIYKDEKLGLWQISKNASQSENLNRVYLVCTQPNGKLVSKTTFVTALKKHGLNSHSFRHTHATMLIEAGAIPVDVAARLGHEDATITQNLYTHDTDLMQKKTVDIFSSALKSVDKKSV